MMSGSSEKDTEFERNFGRLMDKRFPLFLDCAIDAATELTTTGYVPRESPETLFTSWLLARKLKDSHL